MEKIKLPREVVEAIEELAKTPAGTECLFDIPYMIKCVETNLLDSYAFETIVKFYLQQSKNKALYFKAIVNGWEFEETPEDKVFKLYSEWVDRREASRRNDDLEVYDNYAQLVVGMIKTLEKLGITIKGVNDHGES